MKNDTTLNICVLWNIYVMMVVYLTLETVDWYINYRVDILICFHEQIVRSQEIAKGFMEMH